MKTWILAAALIAGAVIAWNWGAGQYNAMVVKPPLQAEALKHFDSIPIPEGSSAVYSESRGCYPCRQAAEAALFASASNAEDVCGALQAALESNGWQVVDRCRKVDRTPGPGEVVDPYEFLILVATRGRVAARAAVLPTNARPPYFTGLSAHAEERAIPVALERGKSFFGLVVAHQGEGLFAPQCSKYNVTKPDPCTVSDSWHEGGFVKARP